MSDKEEVGILESTINVIDKHGFFKPLKALFVLAILFYVLYNGSNVGKIVEDVLKRSQIEHDMTLDYRRTIDPEIRIVLKKLLMETNCDRAFIIEMHNGKINTAGLSFTYGEMTYEEPADGIEPIDEEYQNVNLSRFPFFTYLHDYHSWNGTIEELKKIDKKIGLRMESNEAQYGMFKCVHGSNGKEIGFLGVTYAKKEDVNLKKLKNYKDALDIASTQIVLKLDISNIDIYNYKFK